MADEITSAVDWIDTTVGAVAGSERNALVGGPFGSNLVSKDYRDNGIPVIRGQNMSNGRWVSGDFAFVSREKSMLLSANTARPHDILFTQRGTLGQVAIVPYEPFDSYIVSQSQMKLTVDPIKADPIFIYYLFSSPSMQDYMLSNAIQTGVPHTNLGILRDTPLLLPPIPEQRAIAHILGTLDDKIELNRQMNQTLDEIARTLFKSWFVNFDPVRAKMAGRQPDGMDADTAALFPDRLVDSVLGPIPEGWEVGTLDSICTFARESIRPSRHLEEVFDHYSLPAFDHGRVPIREPGGQIGSNKSLVVPYAILISKLNPHIPRVWMPSLSADVRSIASTEFLVLSPNPPFSREFLYSVLVNSAFMHQFQSLVSGTTGSHQRVSVESFSSIRLCLPSPILVDRFARFTSGMFRLSAMNIDESQTLSRTRDVLLPELLSGQVKVPHAS